MKSTVESFETKELSLELVVSEIREYFSKFPNRLPIHKEIHENDSDISDKDLLEKLQDFNAFDLNEISDEDIKFLLKAFHLYEYTYEINRWTENNKNYSSETYKSVVSNINDLKNKLRSLQREREIWKALEE